MLQYLTLILGSINFFLSIVIYQKLTSVIRLSNEHPTQRQEDSNIQNILNHRLLDIQNRRYSVGTNLERKNGS
jgi:hypothetical protein